ncbi:MAG: Leucine-responsive regulatory protein [Tenericutes bacterium ADurb.BinA155]|jgi:DNA-binding Lrp family transcriptional regulator|nr:MAG: Leucine-responsive regulatory protein [Tenericutes bacterium ADurb.BinA155]
MGKEKTIQLLELLEKDATLSVEALAERLDVKPAEVLTAISDLKDDGVVLATQAVINWDKENEDKTNALIEVKVTPQKGIGFDKVAHEISKFPEVSAVYLMSGGYDFAVMLERKSVKEVSRFVFEKLATLPSIASTSTHFILRKYKDHQVVMDDTPEDKRIDRGL